MQQYNHTMEKTTTTTCHGGDPFLLLLHLPEEVLIQILERVPVVSLLRFKCVCKSWRDLIQNSYFSDLHTTNTFNSSSSTSSNKFGSFILRTDKHSSKNGILMLSECEGSEYEGSENGDWYRCPDGSWHKLTTTGDDVDDDDGSRHKFSGGDGGGDWADWQWDNTNYGWYRCTDGKFSGGYWHWDNTNCGWYWVSDGGDWHWDNTNCGWYWGDWLWDDTSGSWYWVGDDDQDDEVLKADDDDDNQLLLKVDSLELPSSYNLTCGKIIAGSCNGIICLYDTKLGDVSLWNPATRQFRVLPKPITNGIHGGSFVALGFDVKTKDYKVLLIALGVQVYSLSTDSWRLINKLNNSHPLVSPAENHGLYMNGCCFFMANVFHPESNTNRRFTNFINSFDFTTEIFTAIQLPDHDDRKYLYLHCFGGTGEKMALFTTLRKRGDGEYEEHYYHDDGYEDCDIWVLNEHGGSGMSKESWTKLHSFQIKNSIGGRPIGISNNGKFAFLETTHTSYSRRIHLYNLVTNKEVKLDILPYDARKSEVYVYKPSLVSVIGENGCSSMHQ